MTKVLALALAGTALWLLTVLGAQLVGKEARADKSALHWVAFDQTQIKSDVAAGKIVFVDVTADWCISCKVNKLAVIERGDVAQRLAQKDVVTMQADWTLPDEGISHYLESFGRFGIPFNAVYGPKAPQGIALSELPGPAEILEAVERAK